MLDGVLRQLIVTRECVFGRVAADGVPAGWNGCQVELHARGEFDRIVRRAGRAVVLNDDRLRRQKENGRQESRRGSNASSLCCPGSGLSMRITASSSQSGISVRSCEGVATLRLATAQVRPVSSSKTMQPRRKTSEVGVSGCGVWFCAIELGVCAMPRPPIFALPLPVRKILAGVRSPCVMP